LAEVLLARHGSTLVDPRTITTTNSSAISH
jgi:hypothetical protein